MVSPKLAAIAWWLKGSISIAVQITVHLDPMRHEGRILLWDLDNSGRDGWVDGKLVAQYASIDSFRGSVRLIPVSSSWCAC